MTTREKELRLAAALDTIYNAFTPARDIASDLDRPDLIGELRAMAQRCAKLARALETISDTITIE